MNEISNTVNSIKDRFKLRSIEYSDDWSVSQFYSCLRTLLMYADKWHERLLSLESMFPNLVITIRKNSRSRSLDQKV